MVDISGGVIEIQFQRKRSFSKFHGHFSPFGDLSDESSGNAFGYGNNADEDNYCTSADMKNVRRYVIPRNIRDKQRYSENSGAYKIYHRRGKKRYLYSAVAVSRRRKTGIEADDNSKEKFVTHGFHLRRIIFHRL